MSIYQMLKSGGVIIASLLRLRKYRVGLSLIITDELQLDDDVYIGHFNFIRVHKLVMKKGARIGNLNFIKGSFELLMDEKSEINLQNKITSRMDFLSAKGRSTLSLHYHAKIGVKHLLDLTDNIIIGKNSMLAGANSQVWTHGFYFSKEGEGVSRIDGEVCIGRNCYLGARCVICAGVSIPNTTTIGANTCVTKSLLKSGLYVNQPLRFIDFDPDIAIEKYGVPIDSLGDTKVYRK